MPVFFGKGSKETWLGNDSAYTLDVEQKLGGEISEGKEGTEGKKGEVV